MTLPDGGIAAMIAAAYVRMIEEVSFLSASRVLGCSPRTIKHHAYDQREPAGRD